MVGNSHVVSGCEANPGGFWVKGDGAVKVWRVSDGRCVQTIGVPGHAGDVVAICEARTAGYEGNGVSTGTAPRVSQIIDDLCSYTLPAKGALPLPIVRP